MRLHTTGPFRGCFRHGYNVILADPPWRMETWGETNAKAPPYPTMSEAELLALDVNSIAAEPCHLFMWTTHPHLAQSIRLMKAWGFVYSTVAFTWVKTNADGTPWRGMGKTTRKSTELVLLGRHGDPRRNAKNLDEMILQPPIPQPDKLFEEEVIMNRRGEHSVKPIDVWNRIEAYAPPEYRKIELFARRDDLGDNWKYWGNQTSLYNGTPVL